MAKELHEFPILVITQLLQWDVGFLRELRMEG
jgi:hypothetical protein